MRDKINFAEHSAVDSSRKIKKISVKVSVLPPIAYSWLWLKKIFLILLSNAVTRLVFILLTASAIVLIGAQIINWRASKFLERQQVNIEYQKRIINQEQKDILEQLNRHIILPADENPAIATVTDAETLATDNPFYAKARNGDKVVAYSNASLIILYSPIEDRIINIGPLIKENFSFAAPKENDILIVEIRNGSSQIGLAGIFSDELETDSDFKVLDVAYANKRDHKENILVDLSNGQNPELIKKLEDKLKVTATAVLPAGEKSSEADAVIILGK